jgi:alpha-glucosidase
VEVEKRDPDSIFNFYKRVIALRRDVPALRDGSYVAVNRDDPNVLAYLRKTPGGADSVLVALNMSAEPQTVSFKLKGFGVNGSSLQVLVAAPKEASEALDVKNVTLEPFGVLIARIR